MDPLLSRFTAVLNVGFNRTLLLSDLPALTEDLCSYTTHKDLIAASTYVFKHDRARAERRNRHRNKAIWCLWRVVLRAHSGAFIFLGFLKLLTCLLSFVGPVLLNRIVSLVENDPGHEDLWRGLALVGVLFAGLCAQAIIGAQYNVYATLLQIKLRGALTRGIFARAMNIPEHELLSAGISEGEIANMVQIDASKIADVIGSLHDIWSLPLLILIAFALLYFQVKIGFLAGVAVIVVMIPINSLIAQKIGDATTALMMHKDSRVSYIANAIRGMKSVKMLGLESVVLASSLDMRNGEMKFLAIRKYLDAVCVFLWASLPILVPFCTFLTTVLIGEELTASEVFTTIALLNMLIFPMNAFPWVINGAVEASISARRVLKLLFILESNAESYNKQHTTAPGFEPVGRVDFGRGIDQRNDFAVFPLRSPVSSTNNDRSKYYVNNETGNFIFSTIHFVHFRDVFARWSRKIPNKVSGGLSDKFELGPLSLTIPMPETFLERNNVRDDPSSKRDYLVCVCGAVGSGKSMLLKTILQETFVRSGAIKFTSLPELVYASDIELFPNILKHEIDSNCYLIEDIAFCPQVPAMYSGTVRWNITIGLHSPGTDVTLQRRYDKIFEGCGLSRDFFNSGSTRGSDQGDRLSDLTQVGQSGNRLSGGQRLRVGLARALYSNTPLILLDDPFSALDDDTAANIMLFLKKFAEEEQRLVIFSTHKLHLISEYADRIIFLDSGRCLAIGTVKEMWNVDSFCKLLKNAELVISEDMNIKYKKSAQDSKGIIFAEAIEAGQDEEKNETNDVNGSAIEAAESGNIKYPIYYSYCAAAGVVQVTVTVLSTFLMQVTAILMQYWLAYWVANSASISDVRFVAIFGLICAANVICALVRSFSFAKAGLNATRTLYVSLTKSVLFAPLHFFELASLGRIINRFGKETERVDENLPFMANIVLAQFFSFLGAIIIICISNYLMIAVIFCSMIRYHYLQHFYRASSREVRRLESTYRSPLYTLISDCIGDALAIKASRQLLYNVEALVASALDESLRVALMSCYSAQWLNVRLQMLGAIITASVGLLAVLCAIFGIMNVSPGLFGLALALSFSLVGNLNGLVTAVTETEQEMISVERIMEYCSLQSEFSASEVEMLSQKSYTNHRYCCCLTHKKEIWTGRKSSISFRSSLTQNFLSGVDSMVGGTELVGKLSSILSNSVADNPSDSYEPLLAETDEFVSYPVASSMNDAFDGSICFSGLYMSYDDAEDTLHDARKKQSDRDGKMRYALSGINLIIPGGSRVALLGRTGSGKTSLFRALLGLNSYTGSLLFCGQELRDIPLSVLRGGLIGVIPQDPFLFAGSVRYNLDPFEEFDDHDVVAVLKQCGLVETFSVNINLSDEADGEQTRDVENFARCDDETITHILQYKVIDLSTGQKQLICLARCLLRETRLVLVDEATSSLDPQAEANLFKTLLSSVSLSTTIVIICHNPDAITPFCNVIIELEKGHVVSFQQSDTML